MKKYTCLKHNPARILLMMIFLVITFWAINFDVFATDAENSSANPGNKVQKYEFLDLPQVEGALYLECTLPKTRMYIGERILATITLYCKDNLGEGDVDKPALNQLEFSFDQVGSSSLQKFNINGDIYQVMKFTYLISPLKIGAMKLGPITQNCYLTLVGTSKRRTLVVTSQRIPVKVIELPNHNKSVNFSGGVGNFQLDVSVAPHKILQGEPLTIRMTVSGEGNLQGVSAPILQNPPGLKIYPALKNAVLSTSNGFWDKTTFEQTVIPLDKKLKQIGPYIFTYFDPNAEKYMQLTSPAIPISVKLNPRFKNDQELADQTSLINLAPIKKGFGELRLQGKLLLEQPWFWLWQLLPIFILIGAVFYRRYLELIQSDSPRGRAIRSANIAKQQLAAAQMISNEGRYEDLLEQLHLTLREYLGERFNLPVAGMTGSVVHILEAQELPQEILPKIQQFFEQYDLHRFAKTKFSADEAFSIWNEINEIISILNQTNNNPALPLISKPTSQGKEPKS